MKLLYTNCVPTLTYACGVKEYRYQDKQNCNVALNDAIRKIFSFNRWESVRTLRLSFGYGSLTEIVSATRRKFFDSLPLHSNTIIAGLARYVLE